MQNKSTITEQEITRRLDALPDEIAEAFESDATAKIILDAGRENGLTIDKIGQVAKEVGYVMLGLVTAAEFASDLAKIIGDKNTANAVAEAINQKVLLPIREAMKRTYGEQPAGNLTANAQATSAKPIPQPTTPPPSPKAIVTPSTAPRPPLPTLRATEGATKKPEPLIIRPLQSIRRETPPEIADMFKPAPAPMRPSIPTPMPMEPKPPAPIGAPRPPQAAPMAARETIPSETKPIEEKTGVRDRALSASQEKPAPIIGPLGISPAMPMPPKVVYEKAKDTVKKELEEFQKYAGAKETKAPEPEKENESPALSHLPAVMITKEELQKEIDKFQKNDQVGEDDKSGGIVPEPAPLKLPQQKIPKPSAPERYGMDPYKENIE